MKGEHITATCRTGRGQYLTTNRRILLHRRTLTHESLLDLSYHAVATIACHRVVGRTRLSAGIVLIVLGLLALAGGSLFSFSLASAIGAVLALLGVAFLALAFVLRHSYCQLGGTGPLADPKERLLWRVEGMRWADILAFAQEVRRHLDGEPAPQAEEPAKAS